MTLNEFVATLNPYNPFSNALAEYLAIDMSWGMFERKDEDLVEVVESFSHRHRRPVVDKKLQMVFGTPPGVHEMLRAYLRAYHEARLTERGLSESERYSEQYLTEGHGYYISTMRKDVIVVGQAYKPDRFDKDLFLIYKVDRTI